MVQKKGAYTVITGASSGIGDETAWFWQHAARIILKP